MRYILRDLEGVIYDPQKRGFVDGFIDCYHLCKELQLSMGIASGATLKEISQIDDILNIKKLFGVNIFSLEQFGLDVKSDKRFFEQIINLMGVDSLGVMIDDGLNGLIGAKCCDLTTIYLGDGLECNKKYIDYEIKNLFQLLDLIKKLCENEL